MFGRISVRLQTSALFAFASGIALASIPGCATNRPTLTAANRNPASDSIVCKNVAELADLETALDDVPDLAASSQVSALLVDQERLGTARVAIGAFSVTGVSAPIRPQVEAFAQQLTTAVAALEAATLHLDQTAVAVRAVALEASVCRNVHIASLRRVTSAQGQLEAQYAPALTADERRDAQTILQSIACAPQIRLGLLVADTNQLSNVSLRGTIAQAKELSLTGPALELRTRVTNAFELHAASIEAYQQLFTGPDKLETELRRSLEKQRRDLLTKVHETRRACLQSQLTDESIQPVGSELRRVTVTVTPKWSGKLKEFTSSRGFGSGFVVRFRDGQAQSRTLIVTNRHVMDGAIEADLLAGDAREDASKAKSINAKLLFLDPNDDIAILGIEGSNAASLASLGLSIRREPVVEQEGVVAAGFPGAAGKPSFQITKGIVSNSHFEGESDDVGVAYIQHTAPIDPGNSGGPLLDERGRVVGMNTAKMVGRENTNIAIPAARILASLARASKLVAFDVAHARAACAAALSALSASAPRAGAISRFGRELFQNAMLNAPAVARFGEQNGVNYRRSVQGGSDSPIGEARLRGYELMRRKVDAEGGIGAYTTCSAVEPVVITDAVGADRPRFRAQFRTLIGVTHGVELAEEFGSLRISAIR